MKPISARRRSILSCIARHTAAKGYPPSYRQIGAAVGLKSSYTVKLHLDALREAGRVTWEEGENRTLRVIGETGSGVCGHCGQALPLDKAT
jgi:repressor LexA